METADFHKRNPFVEPITGTIIRVGAAYKKRSEKRIIDEKAELIDPLTDRMKEIREGINLDYEEFYELNLAKKYSEKPDSINKYRDLLKKKISNE